MLRQGDWKYNVYVGYEPQLFNLKQDPDEIKNLAKQVNAQRIVLYPYAHLSSSLSNPTFAQQTLEQADKQLKKSSLNTQYQNLRQAFY